MPPRVRHEIMGMAFDSGRGIRFHDTVSSLVISEGAKCI